MSDDGRSGLVVTNLATLQVLDRLAGDAPATDRDDDEEETDEIELPEFVVGDDDGEEGNDSFDDDLPQLRDDGGDPLDDANANDLEIGIDIRDDSDRDASVDGNEEAVDVGSIEDDFAGLDDEVSALDDGKEGDALFDDDGLNAADEDVSEDDGGSEGTGEDVGNDVDESALPELDESEHDQADDDLADELLAEAARSKLPAWSASRFVGFDGAGGSVPCVAVAVAGGRVFAVGDVVLTVDEGAHAARHVGLETPCSAVAANEDVAVLVTARGGLYTSSDGCDSLSPVPGFRSAKGWVDVACTPGRIWFLHEGALWSTAGGESAPVRVRDGGVRAITASQGSLVVLSSRDNHYVIERFRGDDEASQSTNLPEDVAKFVSTEPRPIITATEAGKRLAIGSPRGLWLSNDCAESFVRIDVEGVSAGCFAGDDARASLLVLVTDGREPLAHLIRVTEDGEAARLAEVRGAGASGAFGGASVAWDATRELLWIGSKHGLSAFGPARRH